MSLNTVSLLAFCSTQDDSTQPSLRKTEYKGFSARGLPSLHFRPSVVDGLLHCASES